MFPGGSGSQEPFSHHRNQSNDVPVSNSQSDVGPLSPLIESVETPKFAQGVLPGSNPHWSIQGSVSAVSGGPQLRQGFGLSIPLQTSPSTLNTSTHQPHALLGSNYPLTGSTVQPSIEDITPIKQEHRPEDSRSVKLNRYSPDWESVLTT